jgi:putative FmdB family regulatory protein
MPIYEYRCLGCGKVSSFFTRSLNATLEPSCNYCQCRDMQRRMSTFARGKSVQSVHQQYSSSSGGPSLEYYSDPRNIGRQVEESFKRYGMEIPSSVRNTIDAAREGEVPKGLDT